MSATAFLIIRVVFSGVLLFFNLIIHLLVFVVLLLDSVSRNLENDAKGNKHAVDYRNQASIETIEKPDRGVNGWGRASLIAGGTRTVTHT
jgi:hypothetical protein